MGVSTDAILFYGFALSEEDSDTDLPWADRDDDYEYDDWLEDLAGVDRSQDPWAEWASNEGPAARDQWERANHVRLVEWSRHCEALREQVGLGIKHGHHCSGDYPMSYFYAMRMQASRGCPQRASIMTVPAGTDERLRTRATQLGIDDPEIGWWLVSMWC